MRKIKEEMASNGGAAGEIKTPHAARKLKSQDIKSPTGFESSPNPNMYTKTMKFKIVSPKDRINSVDLWNPKKGQPKFDSFPQSKGIYKEMAAPPQDIQVIDILTKLNKQTSELFSIPVDEWNQDNYNEWNDIIYNASKKPLDTSLNIHEIKIHPPISVPKYKEKVFEWIEGLKDEGGGNSNISYYDSIIKRISECNTIDDIDIIIYEDFFFTDDEEGFKEWKQEMISGLKESKINKPMKFRIKEIKINPPIHFPFTVNSQEQWNKLYPKLNKIGFMWADGDEIDDFISDWHDFPIIIDIDKDSENGIYINDMDESLNEVRYSKFKKNTAKRTPQEQLHMAVKEIQMNLDKVNKLVEFTHKMKAELKEADGNMTYLSRTRNSLAKIQEKIQQISNKFKAIIE